MERAFQSCFEVVVERAIDEEVDRAIEDEEKVTEPEISEVICAILGNGY